MTNEVSQLPVVLLVEDNEDDVVLTREGFRYAQAPVDLQHVWNGADCLAFLRKEGPFADAPTPALVLLDLNLPLVMGHDVMAAITSDPALRHIPVVILTTSAERNEVQQLYGLRCSSYIVKPVNFNQFRQAIRVLVEYWFTVVTLPA
jgi:two-component system response regulator